MTIFIRRITFAFAHSKPPRGLNAQGFTLIEMLAVIVIIGLLMAIGAPMLRSYGGTPSIQTATLPSLFDSARSLAISRSTKARVIMQNDPADAEHYRRWAIIMVQTGVDAAGVPTWQAEGTPMLFHSGIYYFPLKPLTKTTADPLPVRAAVAGRDSQCVAYEYDETGSTLQTRAPVMLVRAIADGTRLIVKRPEARDGFYLRQHGGVTRVDRPDQLPAPIE